jgi:hypothetical protein
MSSMPSANAAAIVRVAERSSRRSLADSSRAALETRELCR